MFLKRNETQIIESLETFSTCDISDGLLNLYHISNGGFIPNIETRHDFCKLHPRGKNIRSTVGRAYTVKFVSQSDSQYEENPPVNYIDNIPTDSIIVSGLDSNLQLYNAPYIKPITAIFGGLMARRAKVQQCRGALILGRVRDAQEYIELDFPVYSYGLSTCSSNANLKPIVTGESLDIIVGSETEPRHIVINSGDMIIMDSNGVVRIPCTILIDFDELIEYIEESIKIEDLIAQDITKGKCAKGAIIERRQKLKEYQEK